MAAIKIVVVLVIALSPKFSLCNITVGDNLWTIYVRCPRCHISILKVPFPFSNYSGVIEDAINSYENHIECRIPDIPVYSSEMLAFLKDEPPIQCDDREPWVVCGINKSVINFYRQQQHHIFTYKLYSLFIPTGAMAVFNTRFD